MPQRIQQLQQHYQLNNPDKIAKQKTNDFKAVLKNAEQLKISKHAQERLSERNIKIPDHQWQTIRERMNEAKQKGVTDSLVVMNDAALLVSTKNNTVVTAMNYDEAESKIFTNINGTILINE